MLKLFARWPFVRRARLVASDARAASASEMAQLFNQRIIELLTEVRELRRVEASLRDTIGQKTIECNELNQRIKLLQFERDELLRDLEALKRNIRLNLQAEQGAV